MFGLFFFVMSGLELDISFRFPCKHGNDRGEEKNTGMTRKE